uniref:A-kinase anchoring protein 7 n=1 Tax=Salvator merianae TaxID=96440 RepID=A0A8D0DLY8_SALMN
MLGLVVPKQTVAFLLLQCAIECLEAALSLTPPPSRSCLVFQSRQALPAGQAMVQLRLLLPALLRTLRTSVSVEQQRCLRSWVRGRLLWRGGAGGYAAAPSSGKAVMAVHGRSELPVEEAGGESEVHAHPLHAADQWLGQASVEEEDENDKQPPVPFSPDGVTSIPNVKKKRKRNTGKEVEEDNIIKKKKKDQEKPNYFISIPITNQKIMDSIRILQDDVIQKDNRLSKAMIRYGSFHITLLVMHLPSEDAVGNAVGAFGESKHIIEELLQGRSVNLSFQGVDHFRHQVGFVKLMENENRTTLLKIAAVVKKIFKEKGIFTGDYDSFKPHLTFMKLSKSPKLRKQGVKRIDPIVFEHFKNHYFGDEPVKRLDLCSMLKKKQPNGYYHCESSVIIGKQHETHIIKEAFHRESSTVFSQLAQIKQVLSSPETRMKIHKELLEKGLVGNSI